MLSLDHSGGRVTILMPTIVNEIYYLLGTKTGEESITHGSFLEDMVTTVWNLVPVDLLCIYHHSLYIWKVRNEHALCD